MSEELDNQVHDKLIVVYSQLGGAGQTTTAVNLAATMAQQDSDVLLIDWGSAGEVATALGIQATRGLYDWLHNGDKGASRLGYDRFVQTTPVSRLWAFSGHLPVADVRDEIVHGHLSELMWASSFDYVVCDVPATAAALGKTLLQFHPGAVIIPVALDNVAAFMEVDQLHQTIHLVQLLSPHSQLILVPTFLPTHGSRPEGTRVANLALLQSMYPGAVMTAQSYRSAMMVSVEDEQLVRWIQNSAPEILFPASAAPGG